MRSTTARQNLPPTRHAHNNSNNENFPTSSNFDNSTTRSSNNFNFNLASASRTSFKDDEPPVPKPRKRESLNRLNLTLNEPEDFRIRRNNAQMSGRVVTPRIRYVPSPRLADNNQFQPKTENTEPQTPHHSLDKKRLGLNEDYIKFQTQKSPPLQKSTNSTNESFLNDMARSGSRRSITNNNRLTSQAISVGLNNASTDSFVIDSERYEPPTKPRNSLNWKKNPI